MRHSRGSFRAPLALLVACGLLLAASPAAAGSGEDESLGYQGGLGVAAALTTLLYTPLKLTYAISGSLVGGLAWLFSAGDNEVAGPILSAALRGDYVVTPEHLTGRREIEFFGRAPMRSSGRVASGPVY